MFGTLPINATAAVNGGPGGDAPQDSGLENRPTGRGASTDFGASFGDAPWLACGDSHDGSSSGRAGAAGAAATAASRGGGRGGAGRVRGARDGGGDHGATSMSLSMSSTMSSVPGGLPGVHPEPLDRRCARRFRCRVEVLLPRCGCAMCSCNYRCCARSLTACLPCRNGSAALDISDGLRFLALHNPQVFGDLGNPKSAFYHAVTHDSEGATRQQVSGDAAGVVVRDDVAYDCTRYVVQGPLALQPLGGAATPGKSARPLRSSPHSNVAAKKMPPRQRSNPVLRRQ